MATPDDLSNEDFIRGYRLATQEARLYAVARLDLVKHFVTNAMNEILESTNISNEENK